MLGLFVMWLHFGSFDFDTVLGHEGRCPRSPRGPRHRDLAAAARRRGRQVGAAAAARLVARRDGRSDPRLRPDPRRHDGDRRRLPGGALARAVRGLRVALTVVAVVGLAGALYGVLLARAVRHEAGARVLDDVAAGFMFLAAGLGFSAVAISLLVAHAFYKACCS